MSVSGYDVAAAVEFGLSIPVLTVLWLVSIAAIHRRKDPLRHSFLWLKLAMPLLIISSILNTAGEAIVVVIESRDYDVPISLLEASWRIFDVATFFAYLTDVFILLLLVELALSLLQAFGNSGIYQAIVRYSNFVAVGILFVLVIAMEGVNENLITQSDYGSNYDVDWTADYHLFGAYHVIYWVFSLPVLVLAAFVLFDAIRKRHLQILAVCFLAASLVNLTRATWKFSYAILYEIDYDFYSTFVPQYVTVVDPILYTWFTVVLFLLVVAIGFKKRNGLWLEQQQSYGGGQAQTTPSFQPVGPGSYVPAQQPAQAEVIGDAPHVWRPELAGHNYTNPPRQQYNATQYQQQAPIKQNQVPQGHQVVEIPN